jgi:hypothetical protein
MQDKKIQINQCVKCNHKWKQRRKRKPKYCPFCHNPNWNKLTGNDLINLIVGK